jgi:hypothetical protein
MPPIRKYRVGVDARPFGDLQDRAQRNAACDLDVRSHETPRQAMTRITYVFEPGSVDAYSDAAHRVRRAVMASPDPRRR